MVRPDVHIALAGVEMILHAGDVGGDDVLDELTLIAPVSAVYGNTDDPDNPRLRREININVDDVHIHVIHGHELGVPTPAKLLAKYVGDVLVYGHTHRQLVTRHERRLAVNPGAAGARRFNILPSVAVLAVSSGKAEVKLISLAS